MQKIDSPIYQGYVPGAIGAISALHARQYAESHGLGLYFEAKVARDLADFLENFDAVRDWFRTIAVIGEIAGSIAISGGDSGGKDDSGQGDGGMAHLRWFILAPAARGQGAGRRLLAEAMDFCREAGYRGCYLWTMPGLPASMRLYREQGFEIVETVQASQWGEVRTEIRMETMIFSD